MDKAFSESKTSFKMDWDNSFICVKQRITNSDIICSQIVNLGGTFIKSETYVDYNFIGVKDRLIIRQFSQSGPGFMLLNKNNTYTSEWMHVTNAGDLAMFLNQVLEHDFTKEITKKWYTLLDAEISIVTVNSHMPPDIPKFFIEIFAVKDKPQLPEDILKKLNVSNFNSSQKIDPFSRKRKYDQI